jgi:MYXO-CTERM domain-containing protein
MRNIGTQSWNSSTHLATTQPRDRVSQFAGTGWLMPDRPAGVTGTVAPGATFQFNFTVNAPASLAPGRYTEYFGMVQEGTAWFSDTGQAGPPDNQLEAIVEVLPAVATDGGTTTDASVHDASTDASSSDAHAGDAHADGATVDGSARADGGLDGGQGHVMGGCGCRVAGGTGSSSRDGAMAFAAIGALAVIVRRRRA